MTGWRDRAKEKPPVDGSQFLACEQDYFEPGSPIYYVLRGCRSSQGDHSRERFVDFGGREQTFGYWQPIEPVEAPEIATTCVYCGSETTEDDGDPAPVEDEKGWSRKAKRHAAGCEWIRTRAHSRI